MKYISLNILIILFLLASCSQEEKPVPVAQVGQYTLYMNDIAQVAPEGMAKQDSSLWADDYINKWVKQTLMIIKAETNLTLGQKDVKKELDEYRNALITFRYKDELIKQKLDTVVSKDEILRYYSSHKEEFNLNQDIVKAIYVKIPTEVAEPEILKSLFKGNELDNYSELNDYCLSYAKRYDKFDDGWVPSKLVFDNLPMGINDLESLLKKDKFIEAKDFNFYYLVYIRDYRLVGDAAPIDYVESQVKNLILNARKIQFLKEVEDDVYKEGVNSSNVKIFTIKKS